MWAPSLANRGAIITGTNAGGVEATFGCSFRRQA
jgi:hypothetical protein